MGSMKSAYKAMKSRVKGMMKAFKKGYGDELEVIHINVGGMY